MCAWMVLRASDNGAVLDFASCTGIACDCLILLTTFKRASSSLGLGGGAQADEHRAAPNMPRRARK